jgi:type IV pilus assembly protein PilC
LLKVVPQFEDMFSNFGAELPKFTQMVLNLSNFMQNNWSTIFGIIVVIIIAFKESKKRSKKFNDFLEALSLKAPIIKGLVKRSAIARFTRTLSTTQGSGVNLIEGLVSGAGATGNSVYRDAIFKVRDQVATGQSLSFALQATSLFPPMVVQMTEIGEESGNLEGMLSKVAILYEEEVDNAVENLTSLMEPMIMAFLGVVVGGLIIAMYLPVFKMGSAV